MEMTKEIAQKVLDTVDAGLTKGLGKAVPGQMCVEAAVCFAMGLSHSDKPVCVGDAVRSYKICLNDSNWSSKKSRAKGMRRVAVAQLGSDQIDQLAFSKEVTLQVTRQILPIALRAAAKLSPSHTEKLEASAIACEALIDFSQVIAAANTASDAAYAAANTAANAAYAASDAAYAASDAAANAAAYAAAYTAAYTASDAAYTAANAAAYAAANAASDAAYTAAYAAANAAYTAANAAADAKDDILTLAAEIGVQALIKQSCKGCEWLILTDGEES